MWGGGGDLAIFCSVAGIIMVICAKVRRHTNKNWPEQQHMCECVIKFDKFILKMIHDVAVATLSHSRKW